MFIGHFAVGFAAKRVAPNVSLAWLLLAPLLLDALWPIFLFLGWESVRIDPGNTVVTPLDLSDYPYTHSLVGALVWSLLYAAVYGFGRKDRRAAIVLGAGVFSHFVLDVLTHRPDMPLYPGSTTLLGFGLWNSLWGTLVVELAMFFGAVFIYTKATRARNRTGNLAWWVLVGLLLVLYFAAIFGPPPPSAKAVMGAAFASFLFLPWAWWIDRNRSAAS